MEGGKERQEEHLVGSVPWWVMFWLLHQILKHHLVVEYVEQISQLQFPQH